MDDEKTETNARPDPAAWELPESFKVADLQSILVTCGARPMADTDNARAIAKIVSMLIYSANNPPTLAHEHRDIGKNLDKLKKAWGVLEHELPKMAENKRGWAKKARSGGFAILPEAVANEMATDRENDAALMEEFIITMSNAKDLFFWVDRRKKGQHGAVTLPPSENLAFIFMHLGWAWEEAGNDPESANMRYSIIEKILHCHYPNGKIATADAIRKAIEKVFKKQPELKTPESYSVGTK